MLDFAIELGSRQRQFAKVIKGREACDKCVKLTQQLRICEEPLKSRTRNDAKLTQQLRKCEEQLGQRRRQIRVTEATLEYYMRSPAHGCDNSARNKELTTQLRQFTGQLIKLQPNRFTMCPTEAVRHAQLMEYCQAARHTISSTKREFSGD